MHSKRSTTDVKDAIRTTWTNLASSSLQRPSNRVMVHRMLSWNFLKTQTHWYCYWWPILRQRKFTQVLSNRHGPLTKYVWLLVAHAPEYRERFPRHQLQRKPLVSDPGMQHGTCVTHVPWCMSGSLTHDGRENVPGIPGACATCNSTYLVRGPLIINGGLAKPGLTSSVNTGCH